MTDDEATQAFDAYNTLATELGLPRAIKLTSGRASKLNARLKDFGLDGWNEALDKIRKSSFLRGSKNRDWRHSGWQCNLDFLLQESSFIRVLEGVYDDAMPEPFGGAPRAASVPDTSTPEPPEISPEKRAEIGRKMKELARDLREKTRKGIWER